MTLTAIAELPKAPNREEVFALPKGEFVIRYPAAISEQDYDDVVAWMEIFKRKLGRMIVEPPPTPEPA